MAHAIAESEDVYMLAEPDVAEDARRALGLTGNAGTETPENGSRIHVLEMGSDDAWARDVGPTFVKNRAGDVRGIDWEFNAWGGTVDGLYAHWEKDDQVAERFCEALGYECYEAHPFVLEGGSIHVDGEGTVMTTEMCLVSEGRNPQLTREQIEEMLCSYLNCEKVIWVTDGIDPEETNGHIDDVACFIRPGEAACIYTEDEENPFYEASRKAYDQLCRAVDARGRKLKVHKLCLPKKPVLLEGAEGIDQIQGTMPREDGDVCIASYMNFLIVNGGVIVPQYGDENDETALAQIREMFPDREVVGVRTKEVVFGGGNIHCITQQQPK